VVIDSGSRNEEVMIGAFDDRSSDIGGTRGAPWPATQYLLRHRRVDLRQRQ
jgi:hypothetical protein